MPKKTLLATLILAILAYASGYFNYAHTCVAFLALTFYASLTSAFLACVSITCPRLLGDLHKKKRKLIPAAIICIVIFKISAWAVNNYYLFSASSDLRFVTKASIFAIAMVIALHLVTGQRKKIMLSLSILLMIAAAIAPIISRPNSDAKKSAKGKPNWRALNTIPYLATVTGEDKDAATGVTFHDYAKAYKGINIWFAIGTNKVHLMDMEGRYVHTWSFGDNDSLAGDVLLCENGDILGTTVFGKLQRLDFESNIKWANCEFGYHHEIGLFENGDIYSFGKKASVIFIAGLPLPIREENIVIMSKNGKVKETTSLLDVLKDSFTIRTVARTYWYLLKPGSIKQILRHQLSVIRGKIVEGFIVSPKFLFDNLHPNTITPLDRDIKGFCNKGDLLICIRNLDMIAVLDPKSRTLKWEWNVGHGTRPHHATLLENNNILLFENDPLRKYSRVIEINPVTKELVWEYKATPPETFFSKVRGGAQRLPNGNTLITESSKGHAFEVTPQGNYVWGYYSSKPGQGNEERPMLYRMLRIVELEKYPFLEKIK